MEAEILHQVSRDFLPLVFDCALNEELSAEGRLDEVDAGECGVSPSPDADSQFGQEGAQSLQQVVLPWRPLFNFNFKSVKLPLKGTFLQTA